MKRLPLSIVLAIVLGVAGQAAADPPAAVTCGSVITAPGQYRLAADCTASGITIRASDVHLKLDGHTMTGPGVQGILVLDVSNVHIEGPGRITNYGDGIEFVKVTNSQVVNVTCTSNEDGVLIGQSSSNQIVNNVTDRNVDGIVIQSSNGIHIDANEANANSNVGIVIFAGATGNGVHGNGALGNGNFDLFDENPNCDDNNWSGNHFGTANQSCIH